MAVTRAIFSSQPLLPNDNHVASPARQVPSKKDFAEILAGAQKTVQFSQHAMQRLQERNLNLSAQDLDRLDTAVDQMARKGARESLIYLNDIALVVSVANRKVITAMDGMSAKNNIFTNIDSAAIL